MGNRTSCHPILSVFILVIDKLQSKLDSAQSFYLVLLPLLILQVTRLYHSSSVSLLRLFILARLFPLLCRKITGNAVFCFEKRCARGLSGNVLMISCHICAIFAESRI